MLEHDRRKNRVPYRSDRIVVATTTSFALKTTHQSFIGQMIENELQPL
jgi:hypothetical protein